MEITITGSVLRDKHDDARRNYVNLVMTVKKGKGSLFYHIRNYQANVKSNAHRMLLKTFASYELAMKEWQKVQDTKLGRDRIEKFKVLDTFTSFDQMEREMSNVQYRFQMVNLRKLKNKIANELDSAVEAGELSFDERVERKLEESEDFSVIEREAGVGLETEAITGPKWGMF